MKKENELERLKLFLDSDEGKEFSRKFAESLDKEHTLAERWENKFINCLANKSDEEIDILFIKFQIHEQKRQNILYGNNIDGQTSLYDTLFRVFEKLGLEANEDAYGMFSSAVYDWRGYRMELYCGQGCFYSLSKI